MKKSILFFGIISLLSMSVILSCENLPPGITEFLTVTVDDTEYSYSAEYDFGLTEAESTGRVTTLVLTNNSAEAVTVTDVAVSDTVNYNFSGPEFPFTAAVGESAEVSLTFSPQASGSLDSVLSVTVEGNSEPFILNLTGEGNYAPTVKFGISVADAGTPAANGFYDRDGFLNSDPYRRPNYTKTGSVNYYCYLYDYSDGWFWGIDSTQTAGYPVDTEYYLDDWNEYMVPLETGWVDNSASNLPPTLTVYDISGTNGYTGQELTANYLYSDAEGDAENSSGTTFQWYRSDAEDGTYAAITGATSKTYTPDNDVGYFLKVEITPKAAAGITAGTAVLSSPTVKIAAFPG